MAIDAKDIISVVMMAPDPIYKQIYQDGSENDRWFCVERPGLKINEITGYREGGEEAGNNEEQEEEEE